MITYILFYTAVSIRMYGKRIPTVKMPFIVKTVLSLIREPSLSDCKSGTINNKTTATTKPNVPTEINGSVNPPWIYSADPNAGPK